MKDYKDITYRYLKGQKNRTLLTILGIILSVALISAIGTIIVSARGGLVKEAIRENGSYHAKFQKLDRKTLDKLVNHVGIEDIGITREEGFAPIAETTEDENRHYGWNTPYRYIKIDGFDNKSLGMFPFDLKEGRFPENPEEIVIENWMVNYLEEQVNIGDKINLTIGNRIMEEKLNKDGYMEKVNETFEKTGEREYTVVGFIQPRYFWSGNYVTQGITGLDMSHVDNNYGAYIEISDVKNAVEKIGTIAKDIDADDEKIQYNNRVLRLSAESINDTFNRSLRGLLIFVVTLIIISTVAVIYNAFNISVLERINQFGLLRSVGATPKQIRGIVLREAVILSVIGIPIGLFSGVLAMKIVLYIIKSLNTDFRLVKDMEIAISPEVFIISIIVGIITVFLSAIGPARQAGKISPLEAIRGTTNVKRESFKRRKSFKIIRKFMGIEGEIAHKNLRRNRKRFLITVFSMVISIALFITFSTFSDFTFKIGAINGKDMGDFNIYGDIDIESDNIYSRLKEVEDIKRIYKLSSYNGEILLNSSQIGKKMIDMAPYMFEDKKDGLTRIDNVEIFIIGDDNLEVLKGLLKSGSIDREQMDRDNGVLVINNTYAYNSKSQYNTLMEGYKIKVGDKIPFVPYRDDIEGKDKKYNELTVMGVLEKGILNKTYNPNGGIYIITTEKVYEGILSQNVPIVNMYIEMEPDGDKENVKTILEEMEESIPGIQYIDYAEEARKSRAVGIMMSIFLYGFVTIITIISAINIVNTISTNIILRTREIAMIKAVGMEQRRIKRMVAFESLFYGIYAAIFGGAIGVGLTYILFRIIMGISSFEYQIPWGNAMIACIGATFIALLSGAYPLKRINDKVIVESMKAEN